MKKSILALSILVSSIQISCSNKLPIEKLFIETIINETDKTTESNKDNCEKLSNFNLSSPGTIEQMVNTYKAPYGRTALGHTVRENNNARTRLLISLGVNVNELDSQGEAALHHAAWANAVGPAKLLIDAGAHVDIQDKHGRTPLHCATIFNNPKTCLSLITSGADINKPDNHERTPLHYASIFNTLEACSVLLANNKISVNPIDDKGDTPLYCATQRNSHEVIPLLHAAKGKTATPEMRSKIIKSLHKNKRKTLGAIEPN